MEFRLFQSLLQSLGSAEVIRLNYSGESGNYPRLIDAIRLTKSSTPAFVEMVTSLVTMPMDAVRRLPRSGIDRISISLHSLDADRFRAIYGGGALRSLEERVEALLQAGHDEARAPVIDFSMVAMLANVDELPRVGAFAAATGATSFSIHPVIQRAGVPEVFVPEMAETFQEQVRASVAAARKPDSEFKILVARPRACGDGPFTCEQNPFETTHILSNGDVVPCEVMDRQALGNVNNASLDEIWHGPEYRTFRARYAAGQLAECATCIFRAPVTEIGAVRTSWGWHDRDESGTLWSRTNSSFECEGRGRDSLVVHGLLPPGPQGNEIEFFRDGERVAGVRNGGNRPEPFHVTLRLDDSPVQRFVAKAQQGFSPWRNGMSQDTRELGFALFGVEHGSTNARRPVRLAIAPLNSRLKRWTADALLWSLKPLQRLGGSLPAPPAPHPLTGDSVGVIIPSRENATRTGGVSRGLASGGGQADRSNRGRDRGEWHAACSLCRVDVGVSRV
jgi:radical SAM protein with 4Fe4S-binding SPASM domain